MIFAIHTFVNCAVQRYMVCFWTASVMFYVMTQAIDIYLPFLVASLWLRLSSMLYMRASGSVILEQMLLFVSVPIATIATNASYDIDFFILFVFNFRIDWLLWFTLVLLISFNFFKVPNVISRLFYRFSFSSRVFSGYNCRSLSTLTLKASILRRTYTFIHACIFERVRYVQRNYGI